MRQTTYVQLCMRSKLSCIGEGGGRRRAEDGGAFTELPSAELERSLLSLCVRARVHVLVLKERARACVRARASPPVKKTSDLPSPPFVHVGVTVS